MATALKESQVSVLPHNELKDKMDICAQLTGRAKSFVAMEALTEYLDGRVPQTEDLKAGVAAADAGAFANAHDVESELSRFKTAAIHETAAQPGRRKHKA